MYQGPLRQSLGAGHVIDYTQEDFTRGTERYDLILDCVGNHRAVSGVYHWILYVSGVYHWILRRREPLR